MLRRARFFIGKIKKDGFSHAGIWFINAVYERLIPQKQIIWYTDLTLQNVESISLPENIKVERIQSIDQLSREDYQLLTTPGETELMGSAGKILVHKRLNLGAILWLIKSDGKLAGYQWIVTNNHVTPTYFPHTVNDAHNIGIEIFDEYRGKGLFGFFREAVNSILKREGFTRCYSETHIVNMASIKAHLKTDAKKLGTATRLKLFGKNIVIWHDMSPDISNLKRY